MRFHALGLAHTITHKDYVACAFTQKVLKFCAMMSRRGHILYHYGNEKSQVECFEHVSVVTEAMLKKQYGDYDFKVAQFKYDQSDELHKTFNQNTIREITARKQKGDFLLCFFDQQVIGKHFISSDIFVVHPGIGSHNPLWCPYNVFESYAVMNNTVGFEDPKFYNVVIQNYFDPSDFTFESKKDSYLLLLGRLIRKKGIHLAQDLAQRTGHILIVAGQGTYKDATGIDTPPDHVKCVGYADAEKRRHLLSTYYTEPFGGTVIEAGFSGTPVITMDWGVFNETVIHGQTGFRCRTMDQFVYAVNHIHEIRPEICRQWASRNYTYSRVAEKYEEFFSMLSDLQYPPGLYTEHPERANLDWLCTYYPSFSQKSTKKQQKILENIRRCKEQTIKYASNTTGDFYLSYKPPEEKKDCVQENVQRDAKAQERKSCVEEKSNIDVLCSTFNNNNKISVSNLNEVTASKIGVKKIQVVEEIQLPPTVVHQVSSTNCHSIIKRKPPPPPPFPPP